MGSMRKFLYIANLPKDRELLDKIIGQYYKAAFCTDAILVIVVETSEDVIRYIRPWTSRAWMLPLVKIIESSKYATFDYRNLISQIDCYIAGNHKWEFTFIEFAYEQGIKIVSALRNDIFKSLELELPTNNRKAVIERMVCNELMVSYPIEEYEYILFHQGLCESLAFFYWMKVYRKTVGKKLLILCFDISRKSILEESPYVDKVLLVSHDVYAYISIYLEDDYNIKNFLQLHFLPFSTKYLREIHDDMIFIDKTRKFLNIEENCCFEKYPIWLSEKKIRTATNAFHKLQLRKGKTVFLIMDGISCGEVRQKSWEKLAFYLKGEGYDVVTKGERESFSNIPYVFLHPWESMIFAGLCGNIITAPTGISFFIAACNKFDYISVQCFFNDETALAWKNSFDGWNLDIIPLIRQEGGDRFSSAFLEMHKRFCEFIMGDNIKWIYRKMQDFDEELFPCLLEELQ